MTTWDINHQRKRHVHVHRQLLLIYEMEGKTSVPTPSCEAINDYHHINSGVVNEHIHRAESRFGFLNCVIPFLRFRYIQLHKYSVLTEFSCERFLSQNREGRILSKMNLQKLAKRDTFYNMVMLVYK